MAIYVNLTTFFNSASRITIKEAANTIKYLLFECRDEDCGHAYEGVGNIFDANIIKNTPECRKHLYDETKDLVNKALENISIE